MRVMMAYELFSMWQNLGRSFLLVCPFHILHSQIESDKTSNSPRFMNVNLDPRNLPVSFTNTSDGWCSACAPALAGEWG